MKKFLCFALTVFAFANASLPHDISKAAEIYNKAIELQQTGNEAGALALYEQAISLNPRMANAYNNRAAIKLSRNDLAGALADYNKTIELDDTQAQAFARRGLILLGQGKKAEAARDLERAIQLDPSLREYYGAFLRDARKR